MNRVAVLGAGFQGVSVALELATRGVCVDLYDGNPQAITQAGARNEGKIHLGFVYANDPGLDTTRLLVRGALAFEPLVRRWLEDERPLTLSTPHTYAVHRDSMLQPDAVAAHFARVLSIVRETADACGGSYLGQDPLALDVRRTTVGEDYDPRRIVAAFRTSERAVDVRALAARLRDRVSADPRIAFHGGTRITSARAGGAGTTIAFTGADGTGKRTYRQVVNCLWDGRMAIDRTMGLLPDHAPLYRLKHGIFVHLREQRRDIPSTTFVIGQFGDIVNFDGRRLYLSWYPIARTALSCDLVPPDWPREVDAGTAAHMLAATLDAFDLLVPGLGDLRSSIAGSEVVAAVIVAAGRTDIDDPASQLHTRSAIGIRSAGGYHSVDTGKYTMAPFFARLAADRVCEAGP